MHNQNIVTSRKFFSGPGFIMKRLNMYNDLITLSTLLFHRPQLTLTAGRIVTSCSNFRVSAVSDHEKTKVLEKALFLSQVMETRVFKSSAGER